MTEHIEAPLFAGFVGYIIGTLVGFAVCESWTRWRMENSDDK